MDIYGLFPKFKVNRSLNEHEITGQLDQTTRINLPDEELIPDLKVIAINSHYLEMVDKFYSSRGYLSFLASFAVIALFGSLIWLVISTVLSGYYPQNKILALLFMFAIGTPMGVFMIYLLRSEWFAWTHYPIRFDRKNQLVHATRTNGSVFTVPWQDVFFTTGLNHRKETGKDYYISGHVLAEDGITVIDTFCLPASHGSIEALTTHWEFIRRYMDEGAKNLLPQISFCLPIANKKESYGFTFFYLMTLYKGVPSLLIPFLVPLALLFSIPRYIGILTSRRPIWPEHIQAQCQVEQDDPYRLDASTNPKNLWKTFF